MSTCATLHSPCISLIRLLAHSLSLPPFCSHHHASALSLFHAHPFPQCPLTKFLSREKNLDTPGDILMKNDEARVSSININRIPRLLILVAESSRGFWLANNREHRQIRRYRAQRNRYRPEIVIDSILSDRQLIGILAIDTELSIVYSWIRHYIYIHVKKIQMKLNLILD